MGRTLQDVDVPPVYR